MNYRRILGLFLLPYLWSIGAAAFAAEPKKEALVDQVKDAIDRGVKYLREVERGNGHWEVDFESNGRRGGWSSLAMLALLNSGVKPDDPVIERGLKFLRNVPPESTYVVGLQTMVFAAAGRNEDRERIQRNVEWLIKTRVFQNNQFVGWGYGKNGFGGSDNSNTQYALLGLHEAHVAGAKIDRDVWKSISDFYKFSQHPDGGWGYSTLLGNVGSSLTMSTAGLCGLLIAGQELNDKREKFVNGVAQNCGKYEENKHITRALGYIGQRFSIEQRQAIFYNLYGIERAGRLTGLRFLGNHDWYREGCEYLVRAQNQEGFWQSRAGHDNWKVVSTSFALLFLSKGRTPILISKLVHFPEDDWNNDRADARNLVDYASKILFNKQPLAWQIFDAKRGIIDNTPQEKLRLVADLMQSPIAYFNGHKAPRFTPAEEGVLKEYIEQGGFILAEACCGHKEFDQGFRNLMAQLFPQNQLKPLPPEHPLWRAHALVDPTVFKLEGIEMGCKTVVVYSPQDLSCLWESNNTKDPKGEMAFRLGGNIIAYATGLELPKPRLSQVEIVAADEPNPRAVPRGYLKVAQLRHEGDWKPAPRAMRNLMLDLQKKTGILLAVETKEVSPADSAVLDYKFLYMHGRNAFTFPPGGSALENLRSNLQTGGILLADACCGKKAFDSSFRDLMIKLFPDESLKLQPILPEDLLLSEELNGPGNPITTVRCRRERPDGSTDPEFRNVPPALEGIKYKDRWIVIYSKYDIGCALENHQSSDCLGHDHESALRLGRAAVLYALRR